VVRALQRQFRVPLSLAQRAATKIGYFFNNLLALTATAIKASFMYRLFL
jgi:hypothetical protein